MHISMVAHRFVRRATLLALSMGLACVASSARAQTIQSFGTQTFVVGSAATAASAIFLTDANVPTITTGNDIRIRIPATFNMSWDQTVTTITVFGSASGKVSANVAYDDAKTLRINVTTNFAGGDWLFITGMRFTAFTAPSAADFLQLVVAGAGGATAGLDSRSKTIVGPTIASAANQLFHVGDPATTISPITITDATTATIATGNDIRINIPVGFNMTWDNTVATATITGSAAGKVSTTVTYGNANRTLIINVTTNFAANDQIVISGLRFRNFTAASAVNNLGLEILNNGVASATDTRTIQVTAITYGASVTPAISNISSLPTNGGSLTVNFTLTNTGNVSDSYDLLTSRIPGTALTTVSITGASITQGANPDSARRATLAAGVAATVTVTYKVGNVAAGTIDTLALKARSIGNNTMSSTGKLAVTVIKPVITVSKGVNPGGTPLPGTDLTFTSTVTNIGSASASSLALVDSVPSVVQYKLGSTSASLPAGVTVAIEYSNDGGVTWTYVPASGGCSAPAGFDRCVSRIRWRLLTAFSSTAPNNQGTLSFVSRIR